MAGIAGEGSKEANNPGNRKEVNKPSVLEYSLQPKISEAMKCSDNYSTSTLS